MRFKFLATTTILSILAYLSLANIFASESKKHRSLSIYGSVSSGQTFEHNFDDMIFRLTPEGSGFQISILNHNKPRTDPHSDLSWLTAPLHGLTDRDIQASDFRNEDNSDINSGSVNRPQLTRKFVFARDAGARLDEYEHSNGESGLGDKPDGEGSFTITHLELMNLGKGRQPSIKKMNFRVNLSWAATKH